MCQLKADCPENNRCGSDNSLNRTLRRKAADLEEEHKDDVMLPATIPAYISEPLPPLTRVTVKNLAKEINALVPNSIEDTMSIEEKRAVTEKLVQLGDNIREIIDIRGECSQENFDASFMHYRKSDLSDKELSQQSSIPRAEDRFRWRRAATRTTLEELGVEFYKGNLLYSQTPSADNSLAEHELAAQLLRGAAIWFPASWVENSNQDQLNGGAPLHPLSSTKGGAYQPNNIKGYRMFYPVTSLIFKQNQYVPDPYIKEDSELKFIQQEGEYSVYKKTEYEYSEPFESDNGSIIDTEPAGNGWEQVELYKDQVALYKDYDFDDPNYRYNPKDTVRQWRRAKLKLRTGDETLRKETRNVVSMNSNVVKDSEKPEGYNIDAGERVAVHEFFHRLTNTNLRLLQMQRAFLHTRANLGEDIEENNTKRRSIYSRWQIASTKDVNIREKMERSVGYPDSFNTAYSGREYTDGNNEVGTTGFEALYFGLRGGFVTGDKFKADPHYHSFMLGMLATSIGSDK